MASFVLRSATLEEPRPFRPTPACKLLPEDREFSSEVFYAFLILTFSLEMLI